MNLFRILFFSSSLLGISGATQIPQPIAQANEPLSALTSVNDPECNHLELSLKYNYYDEVYTIFKFLSDIKEAINKEPERSLSVRVILRVRKA
jgi:hypothetical protein